MAVRLSEAERLYYIRKLGKANNREPLNQVKREYWGKIVTTITAKTPFNEAEVQWMVKVISTSGQTPKVWQADLWQQMVISIGKIPMAKVDQNKLTFYLNAP